MLKPFISYFGGKWRAAPHYPPPRCEHIIEPFAGGAGYSLRYPHKRVTLVEKNPKVAAVWRYLIKAPAHEISALPLVFDSTDDLTEIPQEARWLIGFWVNNGSTSPSKSPSAWMRSGIAPTSFWGESIRARIASQVSAIRHWDLIEGDYTAAPNAAATWFVDPPYIRAGTNYPTHLAAADYRALADWCRARVGQVLVCEADGANWLPFQPFRVIKANESSRGKKRSFEVLWSQDTGDCGEGGC